MKSVEVHVHAVFAGILIEVEPKRSYRFEYAQGYAGDPVSLTMPVVAHSFLFDRFPPFFEGVLPEGIMLEGLLRVQKIDRDDFFGQLLATGNDLVGAVTVKPLSNAHE